MAHEIATVLEGRVPSAFPPAYLLGKGGHRCRCQRELAGAATVRWCREEARHMGASVGGVDAGCPRSDRRGGLLPGRPWAALSHRVPQGDKNNVNQSKPPDRRRLPHPAPGSAWPQCDRSWWVTAVACSPRMSRLRRTSRLRVTRRSSRTARLNTAPRTRELPPALARSQSSAGSWPRIPASPERWTSIPSPH